MVKVKGVKLVRPVDVDLSKYFEKPTHVTIRPLPVPARARIQELATDGMRYATTQRKKNLDIDAIEQAMPAETTLEIRRVKLEASHVGNNIDAEGEDGKQISWGPDLWDALDEANPNILGDVIDEITRITYPEDDEEGADPTSRAPKGKR